MNQTQSDPKPGNKLIITVAWMITLGISLLPDILLREATGSLPAWLYWGKVGLIVLLLLVSMIWRRIRSLRQFFAVLLAVYLLEWFVSWIYASVSYSTWFIGASSFVQEMTAVQIPRFTIGILLVLVMLVLFRRFDKFFFVKGKLNAQAAPIPLIMSRPSSWRILGPAIAGAMCLGLIVFSLIFGNVPSLQSLKNAFPLFLLVPIFAASNAFGEEMIYRAPWLGALEVPVGPVHTLLMTAVYFGLGHFYGVPYGILGVVMAFIPGWLIGKSMLETRGFFWAWFIHFCMDTVVFFFIALGSITPGG